MPFKRIRRAMSVIRGRDLEEVERYSMFGTKIRDVKSILRDAMVRKNETESS